jgi:ubiquinone/menaquinone biosynthesis C-methylase UbiE
LAENNQGIFAILKFPFVYSFFENLTGARKGRKFIAEQILMLSHDESVLDLGCGPGDMLEFLPDGILYTGIDFNEKYISKARRRYKQKGNFILGDLRTITQFSHKYDCIIIMGFMHHIDDKYVTNLLKSIKSVMKDSGRMIVIENTYIPHQNPIARFLIDNDRGKNVRSPEEYFNIFNSEFSNIKITIKENMLRIPYTHVIIEAKP